MKKKIIHLVIFLTVAQFSSVLAQSKTKSEKIFVQELNTVLKNSKRHASNYEDKMTIDTLFAINKEGILSVTLRYTNDSSYKRVRLQAPVKDISLVLYDLYVILEYTNELVTYFESPWGSEVLYETGKGERFHVGAPLPENVAYQQRVQKALDKVKRYY